MSRLTTSFRNVFSVDLRSLALMRVALGTLIIADLVIRAFDLKTFMTDFGVFPREAAVNYIGDWRFSIHLANGSVEFQTLLFVLAAIFAVMMIFGIRTRLATIASWLLMVSLHNRIPLLLQGGDFLFVMLLFWGMFLPLGARFSVDAALARTPITSNRHVSIGGAAILVQTMSVYFFSAFLKSSPEWFPDGTGIYYALHLDQVATGFASYWRDWLWLTQPLSLYVWTLELVAPVLAFSPFFTVPLRLLVVFCFITLEIGFIPNLRIGLFPLISMTSILLLLPKEAWDWISGKICKPGRLTIYYDQPCGFCLKTCHLLREFLMLNDTHISPAQSVPEINEILQREHSWVVEGDDGQRYLKWEAMVAVFRKSPWLFWLSPIIGHRPFLKFGTVVYHWIGEHRGAFGRWSGHLLQWRDVTFKPGLFNQLVAGAFLIYICWWNASTISAWNVPFPKPLKTVKDVFRLDQWWNMFAPHPGKNDGWLVMPGVRLDGTSVDVLHRTTGPPSFDKPADFAAEQFPSYRWRKYLTRVYPNIYKPQRQNFSNWVCRSWNESAVDEEQLKTFTIYFVEEYTPPPGGVFTEKLHKIYRHYCFEKGRPRTDQVSTKVVSRYIKSG